MNPAQTYLFPSFRKELLLRLGRLGWEWVHGWWRRRGGGQGREDFVLLICYIGLHHMTRLYIIMFYNMSHWISNTCSRLPCTTTCSGMLRLDSLVLVYWGLTPQQQPGSYQGGEMMMMKSVFWWRKPEYPEETTDLRQVTERLDSWMRYINPADV